MKALQFKNLKSYGKRPNQALEGELLVESGFLWWKKREWIVVYKDEGRFIWKIYGTGCNAPLDCDDFYEDYLHFLRKNNGDL